MQTHDLLHLISQYGKTVVLKENEVLFDQWTNDTNLYVIKSWSIGLHKDNKLLFHIHAWDLIGENSFLNNRSKPLKATALEESEIITLERTVFDSFSEEVKNSFLTSLVLFLSQRVYKLNDILWAIEKLDSYFLAFQKSFDIAQVTNILSTLMDVNSYAIFHYKEDTIQMIHATLHLQDSIMNFLEQQIEANHDVKIGKNYIFFKTWSIYYFITWEVKLSEYIISNTILYAGSLFYTLASILDQYKSKTFLESVSHNHE